MLLGANINEERTREYRRKGYWGDATLADYWKMAVLSVPEKTAVIDGQGTSYTYAELDEAAGRVASFLIDTGVEPGDFVTFQLPGWAEFTVIYVACLKAGAVVNPVCQSLREKELLYILNKCRPKVLFTPAEFRNYDYASLAQALVLQVPGLYKNVVVEKEKKHEEGLTLNQVLKDYPVFPGYRARSAEDVAAVLFTSGTEGFPKGVMLTHNTIIASEKAFAAALNITGFDVMLMPAPVGHAIGFHHGVTAPFMLGAKSVLQDIFRPELSLKLIEQERCTCGMGATPFVYDLLREIENQDYDLSSLRFFLCGGAPIPRYMVQKALAAGFRVLGVYGSTESVPHAVTCLHDPEEKIIETDGKAVAGVEVKIVDESHETLPPGREGEEVSRGPNVFVGYLREPELTARVLDREGWYYSGDLCTMDDEGYIRVTGRKKDIIIRGGENISSSEVENILLQHPKIREAGVVGMPDPRLGERVCAYLVLSDAGDHLTLDELRKFFATKSVAKYKCPEHIEITDSLPRTGSGKIKKHILRRKIGHP